MADAKTDLKDDQISDTDNKVEEPEAPIVTRTPEADAPAQTSEVETPAMPATEDGLTAAGSLNATPGQDDTKGPTQHTQRTGKVDQTVFRAPAMTRGSAINQVEVMYGELIMKLRDFDHDGLPEHLQALIDFVKAQAAKL